MGDFDFLDSTPPGRSSQDSDLDMLDNGRKRRAAFLAAVVVLMAGLVAGAFWAQGIRPGSLGQTPEQAQAALRALEAQQATPAQQAEIPAPSVVVPAVTQPPAAAPSSAPDPDNSPEAMAWAPAVLGKLQLPAALGFGDTDQTPKPGEDEKVSEAGSIGELVSGVQKAADAPAAAATPVPTPAREVVVTRSETASGIDLEMEDVKLVLDEIQWDPASPRAVINGKVVEPGRDYKMYRVLKIEETAVTVQCPGEQPQVLKK